MDKNQIFEIEDLPRQSVYVDEWKTTLHVRSMNGTERAAFESTLISTKDSDGAERFRTAKVLLVALCTVDENGERIFDDLENDTKELSKKSSQAIDRLYKAASLLNAIDDGNVEDISKN